MGDRRAVDIGVLGECEPWKLHARFFPSKIGGRPAWLHRRPPQPVAMKCNACNEPLIFLCQVYAPIEDDPNAFHRTLFVFICRSGKCYKPNDASNLKVFRSQLKRRNEFYPYDPPNEDENEAFDDSKCPPLCVVCGSKGPSHCSKCKKVNYCSRSHQVYDWSDGHKQICNVDLNQCDVKTKNSYLFPEWELMIEKESESDERKEVNVEEEMKIFEKLVRDKQAGSLNDADEKELELYTNKSVEDKAFSRFKKRISCDPDQVLRYDINGEPLWIASEPTIAADDVPNCQYCDGKRRFEFQIMPQLLNYLELDVDAQSVDWGILVIFTCANSCDSPESPYKNEFIYKQDIIHKKPENEDK